MKPATYRLIGALYKVLWRSNLLDESFGHYDDPITHAERFHLIMRDIKSGDIQGAAAV